MKPRQKRKIFSMLMISTLMVMLLNYWFYSTTKIFSEIFLWMLPKTELTVANQKWIKVYIKCTLLKFASSWILNFCRNSFLQHFFKYFFMPLFEIHGYHKNQWVIKNMLKNHYSNSKNYQNDEMFSKSFQNHSIF